jgi:CD2 antigen cytoplasmic tail-binding protein 2
LCLGGGATLTASQKLKLKKQGLSLESSARDSTAMLALTELANGLLNATGNMNVYQETYEQISRTVSLLSDYCVST